MKIFQKLINGGGAYSIPQSIYYYKRVVYKLLFVMIRMNSFETYRVCKDCFMDTFAKNPPTLEKYRHRDGKCKSCGREWVGINVGYYTPLRKWYTVRPRPFNSELSMCRNKMDGNCYRGWKCRRAQTSWSLRYGLKTISCQ